MSDDRPRLTPVTSLIPAPTPRPARTTAPATTSSAAAPPAPAPPSPASQPTRKPVERKTSEKAGGTREISFTTPVHLRDRVRDHLRSTPDRTLAGTVLAAVEAHLDRLTDLVDAEKSHALTSGLFPDPVTVNRNDETRVAISMRLSAPNLEVLDQLVDQHHADHRSQLITAALRAQFG